MKAVVWEEKDKICITQIDDIQCKDKIVIKVTYTGICGGDLMIKSGKHPRAVAPLVLGHEFTGTICYVPESLEKRYAVGQRVVVNPLISCKECRQCLNGNEHVCENLKLMGIEKGPGAFTEYVEIPQPERIHILPDTVSDKNAALAEPLAVAVHAIDYASVSSQDSVLILGAGPIGLLVAQVARANGAENVMLSEIEDSKIERARQLGFTVIGADTDVVEGVGNLTNGRMADITIDAAGVPQTAENLINLTGIKGKIVVVAIHKVSAPILLRDLAYKELTILGTRIYEEHNFDTAIDLISKDKIDLNPLVTHIFKIDQAVEAFEHAQKGKGVCKVLIHP